MGQILWILLFLAFGYYLPGRLLFLAVSDREPTPAARFSVSLGLGIVVVNTLSLLLVGVLGIVVDVYLVPAIPVVISALFSLSTILFMRWKKRRWLHRMWTPVTLHQGIMWGVTLLLSLFFVLHYDSALVGEDCCILRAATAVDTDYAPRVSLHAISGSELSSYHQAVAQRFDSGPNDFMLHNQGQRLGPTVLAAPFLSLFGIFGLRLLVILQGLLLPGLGYALVTVFLGSKWGPWVGAIALSLSPYALEMQIFDENFMSLCFGSLALLLLLDPREPLLAGLAMALFLGVRHVGVLVLPGVLFYLWWSDARRLESLLRFSGALLVGALPYLILHLSLGLRSGNWFEGGMGRPPSPHSFLGFPFSSSVLLNFPFVDAPLRSPHTAFPPLVAFPLDFMRRFGTFGAALAFMGLIRQVRRGWPEGVLLVLWFFPVVGAVMLQSNWVEPNKMGVPATVLTPVVIWLVMGMAWMGDRWKVRLPAAMGGAVALFALSWFLIQPAYPLDRRVEGNAPAYLQEILPQGTVLKMAEEPAELALDRERLTPVPWPQIATAQLAPAQWHRRLRQTRRELSSRTLESHRATPIDWLHLGITGPRYYVGPLALAEAIESGNSMDVWRAFQPCSAKSKEASSTLVLDLSTPLLEAENPLGIGAAEGTPLDLSSGTPYVIRGLSVPWSNSAVTLVVGVACDGTFYVAMGPSGVPTLEPSSTPVPWILLPTSAVKDLRLPLLVPANSPVLLLDLRTISPTRYYRRLGVVEGNRVELSSPLPLTF